VSHHCISAIPIFGLHPRHTVEEGCSATIACIGGGDAFHIGVVAQQLYYGHDDEDEDENIKYHKKNKMYLIRHIIQRLMKIKHFSHSETQKS
jgi:hypothetical protein